MRPRQATSIVLGALVLLAAACSSESSPADVGTVGPSSSGSRASTTAAQPAGTTGTATVTSTPAVPADTATGAASTPATPLGDPVTSLVQTDDFEQPVGMSWRPTDGTIYIVEQTGRIVIMDNGQRGPVALDMTDLTSAGGERGLLGLAIGPDSSKAYVNYTNNDGDTTIDEYAINADGTFDSNSQREVLRFDQPYSNHNGGDLQFGPDKMLYIGTGDGGSGGDPDRRALDLSEWLGKMLRIDPRPTADGGYTVPPDNPYVGLDGARPEIWSIGLRNPWRYSFDRLTGDLWIADVGQGDWEEVDVGWAADGAGRGLNFGWSAWEGSHRFNEDQSPDGATHPIFEYQHGSAGCAISGGVRYRGAAIPALVGWYVYGDYCANQVRALKIEGTVVTNEVLLGEVPTVTAVSEGPDGELFVASLHGPVYAITPG
ncbi:MAG: PQQ-dependent sugar dehydrogenase [Ilumatobacteraceae bacterium]